MTDKKPLTSSEKQAARRDRLGHGGLFKRRDFYVHPDDEPILRELEQKLRQARIAASDKAAG